MVETATTVEPPPELPVRRTVGAALLTLLLAAMAAGFFFLAQNGPRWSSSAASVVLPAAEFRVLSGVAQPSGGQLIVSKAGPNNLVILTWPMLRLDAGDFGAIDIRVGGLAEDQRVSVFWRTRVERPQPEVMRASMVNAVLFRAPVRNDPNWKGEITGLGILIVGPLRPGLPLTIESLRAVSVSASGLAGDTARDWFGFQKWNGQSINVLLLGAESEPVSLPLFVAVSTLVGLAAWFVFPRRRPRRALMVGALAIAAAGWLTLDLRWTVNLVEQASDTAATYTGKTWREKLLAADDGELFAFIEHAREAIAQRPGRVFFTSDFAYFRVRAGYHLLPLNGVANAYHRDLYDPVYFRPGDYICFFARSGVSYDPANQLLSWDGKPALRVEPVGAQGFGALFRVLG